MESVLFFFFLLEHALGSLEDPVALSSIKNDYFLRSRDLPKFRGRGSSLLVSNKPAYDLFVYHRYLDDNNVEDWTQTAILTPPGNLYDDQLSGGFDQVATMNLFFNMDLLSTHLAGGVLMVGAAYADSTLNNTGVVYVYSGEWFKWSHQQTLTLETPNENDFFGTSVAINQADLTTAVITCLGCDPFYENSSATYIYRSEPPFHNRWSQQQVLIPYNPNTLYLGYGLSIHNNTLIISGSDRDDPLLTDPGSDSWYGTGFQSSLYVYCRPTGSQLWTEAQQLEAGTSDTYSYAFLIQVEDDTIGVGNGRHGAYEQGFLNIFYPDTPRYFNYSMNQNSTTCPKWSLQQTLVDPLGDTPYGFGSYFAFHGNSLAVTRPLGLAERGLYIYERPSLGDQWSVQQFFQFEYSLWDFYPPTWYGSTIMFGDSGNEIYTYSTSQNWSCLVVSLDDTTGDGWGNAMLLVSAPDGTFDKYQPFHDPPVNSTFHHIAFRYCPLDGSDQGLYTFAIEGTMHSRGIQWQITEEKTGLSYLGDNETQMEFYWEPATRDFTSRSQPTSVPTSSTGQPTSHPTAPSPTLFSFGVKIGNEGILSSGKAIVVDYLQDTRKGESDTSIPPSYSACFLGKMTPISYIVNSSRVSSDSDPPLSSDSILIKWRPVSAALGIGSWESSHMILNIPGGVFVSWLVSLSSGVIMGFIVQGHYLSLSLHPSLFPSFPNHLPPLPDPISSTSLIYFIQYSSPSSSLSSRRLSSPSLSGRSLSNSDPEISVSISYNVTLSSRAIREYVRVVSDQRLYLLKSGLATWRE
jgi:hypothetical protein